MTSLLKMAVGGLLLFLLLWFGVPHYLKFESRRNARTHLVEHSRQDLRNVALGLLTISELERRQPWDLGKAEAAVVSGRELFRRMSQSSEALKVARPTDQSISRSTFCDRWGREIHARINMRGDQAHVVLWSDGPNLRDELGSGDDIVEVCDIAIPRPATATRP